MAIIVVMNNYVDHIKSPFADFQKCAKPEMVTEAQERDKTT